jgi:hypothetical protein
MLPCLRTRNSNSAGNFFFRLHCLHFNCRGVSVQKDTQRDCRFCQSFVSSLCTSVNKKDIFCACLPRLPFFHRSWLFFQREHNAQSAPSSAPLQRPRLLVPRTQRPSLYPYSRQISQACLLRAAILEERLFHLGRSSACMGCSIQLCSSMQKQSCSWRCQPKRLQWRPHKHPQTESKMAMTADSTCMLESKKSSARQSFSGKVLRCVQRQRNSDMSHIQHIHTAQMRAPEIPRCPEAQSFCRTPR